VKQMTLRIKQISVRAPDGAPSAKEVSSRIATEVARRMGTPLPPALGKALTSRIASALSAPRRK
jgi:hypothetical protein